MFCSNCGKEIPDNASFCQYCGSKTNEVTSSHNSYDNTLIFYKICTILNLLFSLILIFMFVAPIIKVTYIYEDDFLNMVFTDKVTMNMFNYIYSSNSEPISIQIPDFTGFGLFVALIFTIVFLITSIIGVAKLKNNNIEKYSFSTIVLIAIILFVSIVYFTVDGTAKINYQNTSGHAQLVAYESYIGFGAIVSGIICILIALNNMIKFIVLLLNKNKQNNME